LPRDLSSLCSSTAAENIAGGVRRTDGRIVRVPAADQGYLEDRLRQICDQHGICWCLTRFICGWGRREQFRCAAFRRGLRIVTMAKPEPTAPSDEARWWHASRSTMRSPRPDGARDRIFHGYTYRRSGRVRCWCWQLDILRQGIPDRPSAAMSPYSRMRCTHCRSTMRERHRSSGNARGGSCMPGTPGAAQARGAKAPL